MDGKWVQARTQMSVAWDPSALRCWALLHGAGSSSDVNQALMRPQLWHQPRSHFSPFLPPPTPGPFTPEQRKADIGRLGGGILFIVLFEVPGPVTHPHQEGRQTPWAEVGLGCPEWANCFIPPLEAAGPW